MYDIWLQKVVKCKYKVEENGMTQVQAPQKVTWLNVLSYIPSLDNMYLIRSILQARGVLLFSAELLYSVPRVYGIWLME